MPEPHVNLAEANHRQRAAICVMQPRQNVVGTAEAVHAVVDVHAAGAVRVSNRRSVVVATRGKARVIDGLHLLDVAAAGCTCCNALTTPAAVSATASAA